MEEIYFPLSALNTYIYCPYRMYLVYICGEWEENYHTTKGTLDHELVHSEISRYREGYKQTTQVYVKSDKYRLVGKIDVVEERNDEIYPVEFKKGNSSEWVNNKLQLCAQAICLEEQLGIEIERGYLWFLDSYRRKEVEFTKKLRAETINNTQEALAIIEEGRVPKRASINRCKGCSIRGICLPDLN
ncbi:CRISPR-associated protein Cas4 [Orenia metallireducens]|uniref:CRISPR-associated exonuclease Cas4 n=1 Tax=Orenia metallireducens TaxID=1413210 RepID=A0A1C0A8D0_9FIRM|nr:CRISPR-associated protein Cas4 [Orenia metallireducens]OCL26497.1 CRISPR-associated protein Cas4 [Orenia metallireducens]